MRKQFYIFFLLLSYWVMSQNGKTELNSAWDLIYKNPREAIKIAEKEEKKAKNYKEKMSAIIAIINSQMVLGESKNVIDNCNRAIILARQHQDVHNEIRLLSMLGNQYQVMMLNDNAKIYFDQAEDIIDKKESSESLLFIQGNLYNIKGILFRHELNCEYALKYFDKALKVYQKLSKDSSTETNIALIMIQKGNCLLLENKLGEALEIFQVIINNPSLDLGFSRYFAQICVADIYYKQKKYNESISVLKQIPINEIEKKDTELSGLFYHSLTKNYIKTHELDQFIFYSTKYKKITQKLEKERSEIINQMIKDSVKKNEEKVVNIHLKGVFISIMLLFVLIISIFIFLKSLKKKNVIPMND